MNILKRVFCFYADGFKNLKLGKVLWCIALIKIALMFGVFKVFFFSDTLSSKYKTKEEISRHVLEELTNINNN